MVRQEIIITKYKYLSVLDIKMKSVEITTKTAALLSNKFHILKKTPPHVNRPKRPKLYLVHLLHIYL